MLSFFFHSFASAEKVKQVRGFGEGIVKLALTLIKHWALPFFTVKLLNPAKMAWTLAKIATLHKQSSS